MERHGEPLGKALSPNEQGKVVSEKARATGKRAYKFTQAWTQDVKAAREVFEVAVFVAVYRKSLEGKAIYVKAKASLALANISPLKPYAFVCVCHCAPCCVVILRAEGYENDTTKKKTALPKALRKA